MFTGIVEITGEVLARREGLLQIRPARPLKGLVEGESIALNGVCLTLDRSRKGELEFRLLPETLRATTLGALKPGGRVNLERSLRVGSRVGGHLVLGHVDGKGKVTARRHVKDTVTLEISLPPALGAWLVPKGPITVDGVSLTVDRPGPGCFSVHLIRHTLSSTTLAGKRPGDEVNLEIDLVAKTLKGML